MKKILLISLTSLAINSAQALTVSAEDTTALLNDNFSISITGFEPNTIVDGGGLNISFDASILQVNSVTIDTTVWNFYDSVGAIDNTSGSISEVRFLTFGSPTNLFDIVSIDFTAIGSGTTVIGLSEDALNPFVTTGGVIPGDLSFDNGLVTISAVPIPAAAWLFGSALMGLAGVKRKCRL